MAGQRKRRTQAIVLGQTKLREQDLILRLLELDGQQTDAIAKGARKPGSKTAARCELFCETDLLLASGRGLPIVSEAHLIDPHVRLRGDLERTSLAAACCEVARLTSYAEVTDGFLYPILSRALRACEQVSGEGQAFELRCDLVLAAYAFKVLAHSGWRPETEACVVCGEPGPRRFSTAAGGAICDSCAAEVAGAEPVTPTELSWVAYVLGATFDDILEAPCDSAVASWLATTAHQWCAVHLDARLRAFEFYLGL